MRAVLGISCFYHDSAAALVLDGRIVAAAQEERFTRRKHDSGFPAHAIQYCLSETGLSLDDVEYVAFYEAPSLKFRRLLATYIASAPRGADTFSEAMTLWLTKGKLFHRRAFRLALREVHPAAKPPNLLFFEHHFSHAASAFFPSPFSEAAILTADGVGEWTTTSVGIGQHSQLQLLKEIHFPHSLGLLYSAFTSYLGFKVNSGEQKLMGLAPYGEAAYAQRILDQLIDVKRDGSFRLNLDYFAFPTERRMTNRRFEELLGIPPRPADGTIRQEHMDLAASIQSVTEEVMLRLARSIHSESAMRHLCLAGGVALNCVANGRLLRETGFEEIWVQPAAGDAGGSVGAALAAWHSAMHGTRSGEPCADLMGGTFLGPSYSQAEIEGALNGYGARYRTVDEDSLIDITAKALAGGRFVGWFQGRMEFGPRALGCRSILADPRSSDTQRTLNLSIKFRESFRPFAPAVLAEQAAEWFALDVDSPYMLLVTDVRTERRIAPNSDEVQLRGLDRLTARRSSIPAVTHVDNSARVQTVHADTNPRFHRLLVRFAELTGCPVLVNTSFNVRGEPIVCTPLDALRCFFGTGLDDLVLGHSVLRKEDQPAELAHDHRYAFEPD